MPEVRDATAADRALGRRVNMHPRLGGDMILEPDDVLEGIGNFLEYDADGNPVGWRLGQTEVPDGRHVYVGPTPDTCVRQTTRPLGYDRPSHVVNYEVSAVGQPPPNPTAPGLAKIPRPPAPIMRVRPATVSGYPASTATSPHWFALAWVKGGRITGYGLAAAFHLENGQSVRVFLPERSAVPEGVHEVALLMAEPGTSRPTRPGPMKVQRVLDLRRYQLGHYDLTGPYRGAEEEPVGAEHNGTLLPDPEGPRIERGGGDYGARVADYTARIQWCDDQGDSLPGAETRTVSIRASDRYTIRDDEGKVEFRAGEGRVNVRRPPAPEGASGWKLLLFIRPTADDADFDAGWRRVVDRHSGQGDATPFPLSKREVSTAGWGGSEEHYAKNDSVVCVDLDALPVENTSGVPSPEDAPAEPEPFGAVRPEQGRLYVRVTDTVRGTESLPSPAARVDFDDLEVPLVVFVDPANRVANPTFVERDPMGDPLHWTVTRTGGYARVEGNELVLGTNAATSGGSAGPSAAHDAVPVDPTRPGYVDGEFVVEPPVSGAFAGTLEAVLRQTNAAGLHTFDQLFAGVAATAGEYEFDREVAAVGGSPATTGLAWRADTVEALVLWRFNQGSSGTKNAQARVRYSGIRDHGHKRRRDRRKKRPPRRPPGGGRPPTKVQDPPEPPWSPETLPTPGPDRPLDGSPEIQALDFDAGLPQDFAPRTAGGATVAPDAAAAIAGPAGLRARKQAGGSLARAFIEKAFAPPAEGLARRHALGGFLKNRFGLLPAGGSVKLHPVLTGPASSGGSREACYLLASTEAEVVQLRIDEDPLTPGAAELTLDTTTHRLAANGAAEVQDVAVDVSPSRPGHVTVGLDGERHLIAPGGTNHRFRLDVLSSAASGGNIKVAVGGTTYDIYVARGDTRTRVRDRIHDRVFQGYNTTRSGNYSVVFESTLAGAQPNPSANNNGTSANMSVTNLVLGSSETREELASRIIDWPEFQQWTAAASPAGAHVVRFTAVSAGPRSQAAVSGGGTGAVLSASTVTEGFVDSKERFAAGVRAGAYAGWTTGGSGAAVTFTATAGGVRQRSSYRAGNTGAAATVQTLVQGSNGDITAHAVDRGGNATRRKIMSAVPANQVFNTDWQVNGAGTDRAVVTVWGSLGDAPLQHLARFEDVDLSDHAGPLVQRIAVAGETNPAATWDFHCDAGSVTERGRRFYRDHTALGEWAPQVFGYYPEGQPIRQDLLLQDARVAVVPGERYAISLFAAAVVRADVPAKLLVARAMFAGPAGRGLYRTLGDVTGRSSPGVSGAASQGWTKHELVTDPIPEGCYELLLSSQDVGAGAFKIQEVAVSRGTEARRTGLYAARGEYTATYDLRTPSTLPRLKRWKHRRGALGATVDTPLSSTAMDAAYRSAPPLPSDPSVPDGAAWSDFAADPSAVPDRDFVQARFSAHGPGTATPVLKAGSPYCEYLLTIGGRPMSTLLAADRSELPGGVAFERLTERSEETTDGRRALPSGRLYDEPNLYPAVGYQPPSVILVFHEETRRRLVERWKEPYALEAFGREVLTLKLSARPVFERLGRVERAADGTLRAVWRAELPGAEVSRVVGMAS